jgi:CAAX prenyl protease-like protein
MAGGSHNHNRTMRRLPTWAAYVGPIALFLAISQFDMVGGPALYPIIYTVKIALVAATLIACARAGMYSELQFEAKYLPLGVVLGIALCALWVSVDALTPHFVILGVRAGFDPRQSIPNSAERDVFIAVRFAGLILVAPVMEELFFRSFILRLVVDPAHFERVSIGTFETGSCLAAVLLMALAHPEWLAAALFSLVMNLLIYRTRSLFACIAAHGATNAALGIYVLIFHAWRFW